MTMLCSKLTGRSSEANIFPLALISPPVNNNSASTGMLDRTAINPRPNSQECGKKMLIRQKMILSGIKFQPGVEKAEVL